MSASTEVLVRLSGEGTLTLMTVKHQSKDQEQAANEMRKEKGRE